MFIKDFLIAHRIDLSVGTSLELAVDELFTNIIRHQPIVKDPVVISLKKEDNQIVLCLKTSGVDDFDPRQVPEPDFNSPLRELKPGGLGVYLVRRVIDDLQYEYCPEKRESIITLVKKLET